MLRTTRGRCPYSTDMGDNSPVFDLDIDEQRSEIGPVYIICLSIQSYITPNTLTPKPLV